MRSSNPHPRRRHHRSTRRVAEPQPPPSLLWRIFRVPRMPSVLNIVRASIYASVVVWTVVCLAIAAHFQGLLISSDLTHFVPFAIFVCSVSLLIFLTLLVLGYKTHWLLLSTRIELACLGLAGTFWIALGGFLASSDSDEAEVECFSSADLSTPIEIPGFSTETYQAQYRVLEAFSLLNAVLIWGFLLFILFMAVRLHYYGRKDVWFVPVTVYPWFGKSTSAPRPKLPAPVTSRFGGRSRSRGRQNGYGEKPSGSQGASSRREESRFTRPPQRAWTGGRDRYDKYHRDASPRR